MTGAYSGRASGGEYGIPPSGFRLPASVRLGPVRLQVADLARSVEFYRRVLGLETLGAPSGGSAALGASGGAEPLVEVVERPGAAPVPRRGHLGLYHFALRVPDRAALGRLARHLQGLDLAVGAADHRVSEALYISDPDGLGVEVYRDRPADEWTSRDGQLVMTTEPLDVDDLMAEVEAPARPETGSSAAGVPSGTVVGHVHFHVADLAEAARFYHDGLGFDKVVWDYPGALFLLSAGGYHHHVGLNTWAQGATPPRPDDARLLSWTLVLSEADDVEGTVENLEAAGFPVAADAADGASAHAPVRSAPARCRARDPWGTEVGLTVPITSG